MELLVRRENCSVSRGSRVEIGKGYGIILLYTVKFCHSSWFNTKLTGW